jgi:phosphoribosylanthranilate isomerase
MIVQIYEIQTPEEAEKCIALGVDQIGSVILSGEAWQQPKIREVIRLSQGTSVMNSLIPLFRDIDIISRVADYYQPHYVHFCDALSNSSPRKRDLAPFIQLQIEFKKRYPQIGIIRSIPVPEQGFSGDFTALEIASTLEPVSDLFLIDTWTQAEPVKGFIGITGRTVDWEKAGELCRSTHIPVLLAGGLSPNNVCEAILKVMPAGADSCTQTNAKDKNGNPVRFKKDFRKVEAFVNEVRRAEMLIGKHGVCEKTRECFSG